MGAPVSVQFFSFLLFDEIAPARLTLAFFFPFLSRLFAAVR